MIEVEDIYFHKDELIRASSRSGEYEDFMIMAIENPKEYRDFVTVNNIFMGDTEHADDKILTERDIEDGAMTHTPSYEMIDELTETGKKELGKDPDFKGDGYVYVCKREDEPLAIGICVSVSPLKKATTEEWENMA